MKNCIFLESIRTNIGVIALFSSTIILASGCGSAYKVEKIKDYRLHIVQSPIPMESQIAELIEKFNDQAGQRVLTYEKDPAKANSAIFITSGLKEKTGGKVGLGQWLAESHTSEASLTLNGNKSKQKIYYSMRLEFDLEYFTSRSEENKSNTYDKQKLFFHEAGHGLEMNHNQQNTSDLMFPDISGQKDFSHFFQSVRRYMRD